MRNSLTFVTLFFLMVGCGNDQRHGDHSAHDSTTQQTEKYTCPMHPQILRDEPGTCPICGMDLVRVSASGETSNDLMLSGNQMLLANVTTQRVTKRPVGETIIINGTLTVDEDHSEVISSRAAGRIEKLYIKETGRSVRKGEPLYTLYSETLLTLQQEYLLAKEQYELLGKTETRYKSFLEAATRKLLLYGLTSNQIQNLTGRNAVQPRITFVAPLSGIVTEVSVAEGQYVAEGASFYRIEDIRSLWVEAELYPGETSLVKPGDKIKVEVSGYESTPLDATVTFLSPEYRANSQITIMRAEVANDQLRFKPGQQAQVFFTHSAKEAVAIPVDAVIRDASGTHVYVQSAPNTFRPRMVKTGIEGFDYVEIIDGLHEGDTIAATGAYLLYSEIILKKGADPMAGHAH